MQLVEGNPPRADSYLIKPKWFTACGGSDVQTIRGHSRSGCGQQPDLYRLKDTEHSRQMEEEGVTRSVQSKGVHT